MPQLKLNGIFPPIPTPFNHSGDLYTAKIRSNIEKWNLTTLSGYVVCGSTGESVYLSESEKLFLWEEVAKFTPSSKLLLAGTGMESVRETIHLTNRAAGLGYKCAMVRTPHYYKNLLNNLESQALYFRAVADQSKIPLMIYNWPQSTGLDISVETVALLSEHPNIIAIKESSGNMDKLHALLKAVRPGFQVLNGSAPNLAESLRAGAVGAVLAYASAAPFSCLTIAEAVLKREYEAAEDWQNRIREAALLVTVKYGIPGLKYAMDFNGYYGGPPRLPLIPVSRAAQIEIETAFHNLRG
jgi:4-hydroxy-2-oxoglutarate aldolase